jgi:hypothetical protein
MKFQQRINQLLRKYENKSYEQQYLTLAELRQSLIDQYYLDNCTIC